MATYVKRWITRDRVIATKSENHTLHVIHSNVLRGSAEEILMRQGGVNESILVVTGDVKDKGASYPVEWTFPYDPMILRQQLDDLRVLLGNYQRAPSTDLALEGITFSADVHDKGVNYSIRFERDGLILNVDLVDMDTFVHAL